MVQDYAEAQFARMVPDAGLEVTGSFTEVPRRGAAFIWLGADLVSQECKQTVIEAVQAAKR